MQPVAGKRAVLILDLDSGGVKKAALKHRGGFSYGNFTAVVDSAQRSFSAGGGKKG